MTSSAWVDKATAKNSQVLWVLVEEETGSELCLRFGCGEDAKRRLAVLEEAIESARKLLQ